MRSPTAKIGNWIGRVLITVGFAAGVVVLLLWLAGKFAPKVPTANTAPPAPGSPIQGDIVAARLVRLPLTESAVGSIRAVHETSIGSKLLARVMETQLKAGQKVSLGEVLIRLDDADLRAKLQQAKAALAAAEAHREQKAADSKRAENLVATNAISRQDYEAAQTAARSAVAEAQRAAEAVKEVEATLEWATIRSPLNGVVIDKRVDVGDMVTPGQLLVTLFDPTRMQLVANVRESLAHRLQVGQAIGVQVEGLEKACSGTISEIVPEAQSASRAFQVKVTGPCPAGVYSGMFGRILIPLDEEQVLVIPAKAVRRVGQLELVDVVERGAAHRRAVRTGRPVGEDVEILSGLRAGEQVVSPKGSTTAREARHG